MKKPYLYQFQVETIECGQRKPYGDSFYTYKVTSTESPDTVKNFCMNVLQKSFEPSKMPDAFAGKLLSFCQIEGPEYKSYGEKQERVFEYKATSLYTG
jgi:hypothetical protein